MKPNLEDTLHELCGKLVVVNQPGHGSDAQRCLGTFVGVTPSGAVVLRGVKFVDPSTTVEDAMGDDKLDVHPIIITFNVGLISPVLDAGKNYSYVTTELRR